MRNAAEIWRRGNLQILGKCRRLAAAHANVPAVARASHQRRVVKEAVSHSGEEGEEGISETHLWTTQVTEYGHKVTHQSAPTRRRGSKPTLLLSYIFRWMMSFSEKALHVSLNRSPYSYKLCRTHERIQEMIWCTLGV